MIKKEIRLMVSIALLVLFLIPNAWAGPPAGEAGENYFKRSGEKLGRGAFNIVFSPLEITKAIESEIAEGQPFKTFTLAPIEGILKMTGRIVVGAYAIATFLISQDPILKPPYITSNNQEYAEAKHEQPDGIWSGLYPRSEK